MATRILEEILSTGLITIVLLGIMIMCFNKVGDVATEQAEHPALLPIAASGSHITTGITTPIHYTLQQVVNESIPIITKYEGLHLNAYRDGIRWSIGYGTYSHAGETITQEIAYQRMYSNIIPRAKKVMKDYPLVSLHQASSLTSLLYNCPSGYKKLAGRKITKELFTSCVTRHDGTVLAGLVKRRAYEWQVFLK